MIRDIRFGTSHQLARYKACPKLVVDRKWLTNINNDEIDHPGPPPPPLIGLAIKNRLIRSQY